jgi:Uma2 family endonuclease
VDGPFKRNARYEDLSSIPEGWVGEIIDGDLYAFARPRTDHLWAIGAIYRSLDPYMNDRGPTGWVILLEPQIRFGKHLLVPDVAGWRRARMPEMPNVVTIDLPPDWVCEGLSPSTARLDRGRKREIYARAGVGHLWFADAANRTIEVLTLDGESYRVTQTGGADERGVFAPFELELDLAKLWQR